MLGASVLMISTFIFFGLQYSLRLDEVYEALQGEASYAASGLKAGGIEFLYSLDSTNRVTWIASDGSILYDSMYPDLKTNQGEFNEVRQALEKGNGQGVRRSSSDGAQTMYYAFLCEDGTVLRLSRPLSAVRYAFVVVSPILSVILLIMIVSAAMAFHIARSIAGPVNEMELDDLPNASPYPELQPLVERLKEQREVITQQAVEQEQMRRETMERQAREQEKMRREFTANVSHELKTPLTSISGFAELMQSGLCDEERMIEFAGDIYRESQRLIALVNDIIRISEIDEGAIQPSTEGVDLVQEVLKTVRILQPAADKRNISISVQCADTAEKDQIAEKDQTAERDQTAEKDQTAERDQTAEKDRTAGRDRTAKGENEASRPVRIAENEAPRPVRIAGSERLIGEMIYNLCDNAIKYNHDGGSVRIEVLQDDKNAILTVEDTGIGIPAAEQERVFERFYRVDKSHSRQIGGTGLGLSIVKHAAQFHSAAISMESEPGKGTRITVSFPVWEQKGYAT